MRRAMRRGARPRRGWGRRRSLAAARWAALGGQRRSSKASLLLPVRPLFFAPRSALSQASSRSVMREQGAELPTNPHASYLWLNVAFTLSSLVSFPPSTSQLGRSPSAALASLLLLDALLAVQLSRPRLRPPSPSSTLSLTLSSSPAPITAVGVLALCLSGLAHPPARSDWDLLRARLEKEWSSSSGIGSQYAEDREGEGLGRKIVWCWVHAVT